MFGLDERIASASDGTTMLVVIVVALLLGLRHASDPDHLAAVTTMIASCRDRAVRRATHLGLTWGLGHATSLFGFGLPVVLYSAYLPERIQALAETSVGFIIVALAVVLLVRWRRDSHRQSRTPWQAYGIGLVHGMGGTAGIGILLLATIDDRVLAAGALAVFAVFSAISMTILSAGFGAVLSAGVVRATFHRVAPAFGVAGVLFGTWYALGAQGVVPYVL